MMNKNPDPLLVEVLEAWANENRYSPALLELLERLEMYMSNGHPENRVKIKSCIL